MYATLDSEIERVKFPVLKVLSRVCLDIAAHNIKSDCDDEWKKTAVISLDRLASIDDE